MQDQATTAVEERQPRAWHSFNAGRWQKAIDVRDFIVRNVSAYEGDDTFLTAPSEAGVHHRVVQSSLFNSCVQSRGYRCAPASR